MSLLTCGENRWSGLKEEKGTVDRFCEGLKKKRGERGGKEFREK